VVLHKFVEMVTELNRSNIAMWFPWLTDLVFFRAYASVRGINRPADGRVGFRQESCQGGLTDLRSNGSEKVRGMLT